MASRRWAYRVFGPAPWGILVASGLFACSRSSADATKPRSETARGAEPPAASAPAVRPSAGTEHRDARGEAEWKKNEALHGALKDVAFADDDAAENLSDAAVLELAGKRYLVVPADEGQEFALVTLDGEPKGRAYDLGALPQAGKSVELPPPASETELDLEAVTTDGDRVLLAGSASLKRKKPKRGDFTGERLTQIVPASGANRRYANFAYELRARPGSGDFPDFELVSARDVRELLLALPPVATFRDVPSKDNGLDLEALLVHGEHIYFGLRGPVLRGRALLVRTRRDFSEPVVFSLDLKGLGVRALGWVAQLGAASGLYLIAGPTLPREDHFELYRFRAFDRAPGDVRREDLESLGALPSGDDRRPEGMFVLGAELCVLHDGTPGGAPSCRSL